MHTPLKSAPFRRLSRGQILPALLLALSGCGGGGNESGDPAVLRVEPAEFTISGAPSQCAVGTGPDIHVWGGQPPYKLTNSVPTAMGLSTSRLNNSGDGFTITFFGTCLANMPIAIEDDMGRIVTVRVTNTLGT